MNHSPTRATLLSRAERFALSRAGLPAWIAAVLAVAALAAVFAPADNVFATTTSVAVVCAGLVAALRVKGARPACIAIALAAMALASVVLGYTSIEERSFDSNSHLAYIEQLARSGALPATADCSVCHHPPLYYVIAAGVLKLAAWGVATPTVALQLLSFALYAAFLAFSVLTIDELLDDPPHRALAVALVAFWPYGFMHAVRVSNDALLAPLLALAFYGLVRWHRRRGVAALAVAAVATLLAFLTKANALLMVPVVLVTVGLAWRRTTDRAAWDRKVWTVVAGMLLGIAVLGAVRGEGTRGLGGKLFGGTYKTESAELAPLSWNRYLWLDVLHFVREPYALALHEASAEPTYWNHFLKSSVLGTRNHRPSPESDFVPRAVVAQGLNALLLVLVAILLAGAWLDRERNDDRRTLAWTLVLPFVGGALAFHVMVPTAHHADFRFVYPVVIPLGALWVRGAAAIAARWRAGRAAPFLGFAFVLLSAAYFAPRPGSARRHEPPPRPESRAADGVSRPRPPGRLAPGLFRLAPKQDAGDRGR